MTGSRRRSCARPFPLASHALGEAIPSARHQRHRVQLALLALNLRPRFRELLAVLAQLQVPKQLPALDATIGDVNAAPAGAAVAKRRQRLAAVKLREQLQPRGALDVCQRHHKRVELRVAAQRAVGQHESAQPRVAPRAAGRVHHLEEVRRHRYLMRTNHVVRNSLTDRRLCVRRLRRRAIAGGVRGRGRVGQKQRAGDDVHVGVSLQQRLCIPLQPQPVRAIV
mmetsp:Transcript_79252/g.237496  ORF Transcript_79252/g.237496 Transcript_79252/m.237496 type:complete len:224 (-) Transcript_79252:124-795(-)